MRKTKNAVLEFLALQGLDFKPSSQDRAAFNEIAELIRGLDPDIIDAVSFDNLKDVLER